MVLSRFLRPLTSNVRFSKLLAPQVREWAVAPLALSRDTLEWGQTNNPNLFIASTVLSHSGNDIHTRHAPILWRIDISDPCITVFPSQGLLSTTRMPTLRFEYDARKGSSSYPGKDLSSNIVIRSTPIRREWKLNDQALHDRLYTYDADDPEHIWQIVNTYNPVLDELWIKYAVPQRFYRNFGPSVAGPSCVANPGPPPPYNG